MRVFHFLSAEYALLDIMHERIKVSRINDLNDPFELIGTDMRDKERRKLIQNFKNEIDAKYGIICFSRSWQNPLLWSHYSDKHRGVCFGFEIPDTAIKEISYTGSRLLENLQTNSSKNYSLGGIEKFLTTKFKDWKYEDEVRVIYPLRDMIKEDEKFFKLFDAEIILNKIILGARCELTNFEIEKLAHKYCHKIEIIRSRLAFKSFRVVKNLMTSRKS